MTWFIVQSLITLVLAFALGVVVGWLIWARRRPADTGRAAELAAAKEKLAACTCDAGAAPAADGADVDLDPEGDLSADADLDGAADADLDSDADADLEVDAEAELTSQDDAAELAAATDDAEELVATYEALEEIDVDLDSPTVSADGAVESDADDMAALALAVGALTESADDHDPDDIERIEGIGPKIGKALRGAGLDTYAAIADASLESLREAIKAGGVKFAPSVESWSSQARLLADGDEAGFKALTGRLVAGRVKD